MLSTMTDIFKDGSKDAVLDTVVSLMLDEGETKLSEDDFWIVSARDFASTLISALVWKRDNQKDFNLSAQAIVDHLPYERSFALQNEDLADPIKGQLSSYFKSLRDAVNDEDNSPLVIQQHGYRTMVLKKPLEYLGATVS